MSDSVRIGRNQAKRCSPWITELAATASSVEQQWSYREESGRGPAGRRCLDPAIGIIASNSYKLGNLLSAHLEPDRAEATTLETVDGYLVSRCLVCLRHHRQYLANSRRSRVLPLFLVVT